MDSMSGAIIEEAAIGQASGGGERPKARAGRRRPSLAAGPLASPLLLVFLSFLSGLLMALGQPNELFRWGNPLIGLVALVPLFVALSLRPGWKLSFLMGAVYGATAHAAASYWLWFFKDFALWTLGSTVLTYAVVYGLVCVWLSLAATAGGPSWRPLLLALGWVSYEFQKSTGFLAYPWGLLPYSWNTVLPFVQLSDVTGVYGPGLILALANAFFSELVLALPSLSAFGWSRPALSRLLRLGAIVLSCFALAFAYGAWRLATPDPASKILDAVMVQANENSWTNANESSRVQNMMDLSERAILPGTGSPDLIVWDESSLTYPYDFHGQGYDYSRIPQREPLASFIRRLGSPLLTGASDIDFGRWAVKNAVDLVDGGGSYVGNYAKIHCVPFAEAIPFYEYPWMRTFMAKVIGLEGTYDVGTDMVVFSVPLRSGGELRFGAPICFEDAFADLCRDFSNRGAEALVNVTNDSWSKTDSAEIQHFVAARFRAIENRKVLIRSTNGGLSAWVDASGRVHDPLPLFASASQRVRIPISLPRRPTAYDQAGDLFAWSLVFLFASLSLILMVRQRREGEKGVGDELTRISRGCRSERDREAVERESD